METQVSSYFADTGSEPSAPYEIQPSLFCIFAGEIFELKAELNNEKKEKRKEAVKKVIAAMTVGKDVR